MGVNEGACCELKLKMLKLIRNFYIQCFSSVVVVDVPGGKQNEHVGICPWVNNII